jgi:hypothetical protein
MRTPSEIGAHAVALVHLATDQLAEFIGPSPADDAVSDLLFEAGKAVPKSDGRHVTRRTWEEHGARNLIMAVGEVARATTPDEDEEDPEEDGWDALRAGDLEGAAAAATRRLLELAGEVGEDDWNYGNLVHWGHIIRGHVRLRKEDLPGAAAELVAAGRSPGSPQLDSFGPDLCLVWMLLKRGADAAVLAYLHDISRFWSPSRRCP